MIDAAKLTFEEFKAKLEDHAFFFLKGTNGKVYFKKTYEDEYILGNADQGFIATARRFTFSTMDDRLLWFSSGGEEDLVVFGFQRDKWEVEE